MQSTPSHFKYPWRAYQARILDRLERYREDRKIHVVAPPGAGKTVLGLEIMRRMAKRSLVLAPSLTIRAQWTERYVTDFGADENSISNDLYAPGEITIVTYQAVFAYHEKMGTDGLDWVEALIVDECHHLRREWWRVLDALVDRYHPELVALTATPPYDVSGVEWRRYHDFCGEIDEEISIPELVASGDLCPHQDFLYPILPPPGESQSVAQWQSRKDELLELARTRSELTHYIRQHPWLTDPENHYADIFEAPEYFTSMLSMLSAQGSEAPATALGILHGEATLAPKLDEHWLTVFLQKALREDDYFSGTRAGTMLTPYRRIISTMGAWEKGKLNLEFADEQLDSPEAKLEALTEIAAFESDSLVDGLRMVILTDNIYEEFLPTTEHDRRVINKVGTAPVFETLRRQEEAYYQDKLCVLTGSLVIIPKSAESRLLEIAYDQLPTERVINTRPLFPESRYVIVDSGTLANKYAVGWITQLFTEGEMHIIVGTKSLLGEGWDAPVINSLVLANRVGSFVLSNQMRGRAIRTVRGDPNKTANIWHPMIVHPGVRRGGPDVDRLRRRFRGFAGPRMDGKPAIQNGLERLMGENTDAEAMTTLRRRSLESATQRDLLAGRWTDALGAGTQLVEAIKPPAERYYEQKDPLTLHYRESVGRQREHNYRRVLLNTYIATLLSLLVAGLNLVLHEQVTIDTGVMAIFAGVAAPVFLFLLLRLKHRAPTTVELNLPAYFLYPALFSIVLMPFSVVGPLVYWSVFLSYMLLVLLFLPRAAGNDAEKRHGFLADTKTRLMNYGGALAATLSDSGRFHTSSGGKLRLEEEGDEQFVYLTGAEHHDAQLFASSLAELMSPVDNPRYLLRLQLPADWTRGEYYLAVPAALGKRKDADRLAHELSEQIDQAFEAIYTREPAGRLHLLTARLQASSRSRQEIAQRELLWR